MRIDLEDLTVDEVDYMLRAVKIMTLEWRLDDTVHPDARADQVGLGEHVIQMLRYAVEHGTNIQE